MSATLAMDSVRQAQASLPLKGAPASPSHHAPAAWPFLLGLVLLLAGSGCAYRLGPSSGVEPGSRSIAIQPFQNNTLEPRVTETIATALRAQIQQEGTFLLATHGDGDVVVSGVVQNLSRDEQSFQARDTRTLRDYRFEMTAHVTAIERGSGRKILDREVRGHTMLRVVPDMPSAERQAMPLVAANLARNITSLLVDGDW
jgi:hypothetical protein